MSDIYICRKLNLTVQRYGENLSRANFSGRNFQRLAAFPIGEETFRPGFATASPGTKKKSALRRLDEGHPDSVHCFNMK